MPQKTPKYKFKSIFNISNCYFEPNRSTFFICYIITFFYFLNKLQIQQALRPSKTWIQTQQKKKKITVPTSQSEINQTNALLRWTGSFPLKNETYLHHNSIISPRMNLIKEGSRASFFLRTKKTLFLAPPKTLINFRNLRWSKVENTFSTNSPLDQQQVSFRKPYLIFVS